MCSAPVTLGGGMTMTKGGFVEVGSGLKKPHCSHHSYLPVQRGGETRTRRQSSAPGQARILPHTVGVY